MIKESSMEMIARNDVRVGDLIRVEAADTAMAVRAREVLISTRHTIGVWSEPNDVLYLLDRPSMIPTKPGVYQDGNYLYTLNEQGNWYFRNLGMLPEQMQELLNESWVLLEPRAEVAREIITALDIADSDVAWGDPLDYAGIIAEKFINV